MGSGGRRAEKKECKYCEAGSHQKLVHVIAFPPDERQRYITNSGYEFV